MSELSHEEQAKRILQKYDPKMVKILPSMMKKFEGKEAQLVSMLVKKHGPVPTDAELAQLNDGSGGGNNNNNNNMGAAASNSGGATPITNNAYPTAKPPSRQPSPKRTSPTPQPTSAAATNANSNNKSPNARPVSPSVIGKKVPAPPAITTTTTQQQPSAVSDAYDSIPAQCKRLLEKYDPKMVKTLPVMMAKFEGKEQSLLNMLIKKHGPVPPIGGDEASANTTTTATTTATTSGGGTSPARPRASSSSTKSVPSTPPPSSTPSTKRPASPSVTSLPQQQQQQQEDTVEAQCKRLLEKYDPKMVKVLPSMMKKFEGKEDSLLSMLIKKHGPVPPISSDLPSSSSPTPPPPPSSSRDATPVKKAPPAPTTDKDGKPLPSPRPQQQQQQQPAQQQQQPSIEDQIRAILEHKDPKMIKVLPSMMEKFKGKEATLLSMMCKKHNVTANEAIEWALKKSNGNESDSFSDEEEEYEEEEEDDEEPKQNQQKQQQQQPQPSKQAPQTQPQQQPSAKPPAAAATSTPVVETKESTTTPAPTPAAQQPPQSRPRGSTTTTIAATATPPTAVTSDPQFISLVLEAHNSLRLKHSAPPLQYDAECEASARKCADRCQRVETMEHAYHDPTSTTDGKKHGQNIYWHSRRATVENAVTDWYNEIDDPGLDFENPEPAKKGTGHASQVLWKSTTKVGAAFSEDGRYFVCNYFCHGNVATQYKDNLSADPSRPPRTQTPSQSQSQRIRGASTAQKQQQLQQPQEQQQQLSPAQIVLLRSDLRNRLLRYFQHHDPAQILNVDAELNKYLNLSSPNPEKDFWSDIYKHYGANKLEPVVSSADQQLLLDRIRRMYVHYDPTVLSTELPASMKEYKGKELELLRKLVKQYGAEPENLDHLSQREQEEYFVGNKNNSNSNNTNSTMSVPPQQQEFFSRLINPDQKRAFNMYRHYDPSCLEPLGGSEFDRMLKQYHGREFDWVQDLTKKYGPEPISKNKTSGSRNQNDENLSQLVNDAVGRGNSLAESELHRRIRNMYLHYDPEQLQTLPVIMQRYTGGASSGSGGEARLLKDLVARYGPEPALREVPDPEVLQQRAANVVSHYDPQASARMPELLQRFKGREDQLLRTLVRKYGPEPLESLGATSAQEAAIPPTVSENIAQIRELVSKHEPESAPAIPGLLLRYSGKEETLLQLLRQRYGTSILIENPAEMNQNKNNDASSSNSSAKRQRAVSFVGENGPQHLGDEHEQFEDPRIKGSVISIENRIRKILEIHQPEKATSDAFAKLMKEHEGKEEELLNELIAQHGPEPGANLMSVSSDNKKPKFDHPKEASARLKLTALFTHYDRMQLPRIDEWLEKYTGREEEMLAAVHKKYAVPPPQAPPVWVQPLQKLCLAHGMQETFLEKLISSLGSAATKDNVTFELLNIWYPDFVASLLTDEGQRRTLTAKRLARFLSVVSPGRITEIPDMLHQVVSGGQSSNVVLGDMLLTFYREAMINAVVPRLDHSSLRERDETLSAAQQQQQQQRDANRSVGAGFIGNVEQLKKLLDVWHQQRHHTRTLPQLLGTSATDLIRFTKVLHRAVGPDDLLVKPVRTLGTDTETDSGQMFGSGLPMDGRTLGDLETSPGRQQQQQQGKRNNAQQQQQIAGGDPPPNPLLFSRFGLKNEDIPRTRWGCPNCEALRDFTEQNESRWQTRLKEQELKLWRLMQDQTRNESTTASPRRDVNVAASTSSPSAAAKPSSTSASSSSSSSSCDKCPFLNKEIEALRHRVHQLQTRYDNRAVLDSATQQFEKEQQERIQHQQQQLADGASGSSSSSTTAPSNAAYNISKQLQRYATPRRLFQIEHPQPVATNKFNYLVQQQQQSAAPNNNNAASLSSSSAFSARDLVPLYHTNATAPSALRQPSSTLQRSQELWGTLYSNNNNNNSNNSNDGGGRGGVVLPSSEAARKVLSLL